MKIFNFFFGTRTVFTLSRMILFLEFIAFLLIIPQCLMAAVGVNYFDISCNIKPNLFFFLNRNYLFTKEKKKHFSLPLRQILTLMVFYGENG